MFTLNVTLIHDFAKQGIDLLAAGAVGQAINILIAMLSAASAIFAIFRILSRTEGRMRATLGKKK